MENKNQIDLEEQDQKLETKHHLMAYDLLKSTAAWLESPENEIFGLLEYSGDSVGIAAKACVLASAILKKATLDLQLISGIEDTNKYDKNIVDAMSELKSIADSLDESGDDSLMKKASMLDDILFTIATNVEEQEVYKQNFAKRIDEIKKHSNQLKSGKKVSNINLTKVVSAVAPTEKKNKELRPLEAPLTTRYCPDHPGELVSRVRDGVYQCMMDHKEYDYNEGFTTMKGNKVPGSSVSGQTVYTDDASINSMFSGK